MSVTTKIQSAGLARDTAPELAAEANALRRAENVVMRSPGVIETRPSFEIIYENLATPMRVRALREFRGAALAIVEAAGSWFTFNLNAAVGLGGIDLTPPDYDATETKFAEARLNLYLTTLAGIAAMESEAGPTGLARVTGVRMQTLTDLGGSGYSLGAVTSCAYRIVFVRKDSNGYIRRSPPSQRVICINTGGPSAFGSASRVYFPSEVGEGDHIEFYRSRSFTGISPRPEHFLALTHTITKAEAAQGWAGPISDPTIDDALGVQLYTDSAIEGALAAKFPPPQAQALAWWQRVMWYGRTQSKTRISLALDNLYHAGIATFFTATNPTLWSFETGLGPSVAFVPDGTGLYLGMLVTDSEVNGPSGLGTYIVAGTVITAISTVVPGGSTFGPGTYVTISNPIDNPAVNSPITIKVWSMPAVAPKGLMASSRRVQLVNINTSALALSTETHPLGDPPYRYGFGWIRPGMYCCGAQGPLVDDVFPAGTRVVGMDPLSPLNGVVYVSANATRTAANETFYFGDIITVNGVEFYTWPLFTVEAAPWADPFGGTPVNTRLVPIGNHNSDEIVGDVNRALAVANLCSAINLYHAAHGGSFPTATPIGDVWNSRNRLELDTNGLRVTPGTLATSMELESEDVIIMTCTSPSAFVATERVSRSASRFPPEIPVPISYDVGSAVSDNPATPHRVHFSDLDEPESVPLLNYIDIGQAGQPILALAALRNALLVFKSDGVWRITGSGPSSWTVEPLDPTLRLIRPEAVAVSRNRAYAWCLGGFHEVTEGGSRSISSGKIDVELRVAAQHATSPGTHGVFVTSVQQRNLVLFGVPGAADAIGSAKVYAWNQTTEAWSEWPLAWGKVAESSVYDLCYASLPESNSGVGVHPIDVEVRAMLPYYNGIDRQFLLGPSINVVGSTVTIAYADIDGWHPKLGDWISAQNGAGTRFFRRIISAAFAAGAWTFELEAEITSEGGLLITDAGDFFVTDTGLHFRVVDLSLWLASEAITMVLEWHPVGPARVPIGALVREQQFQLDLRDAPDPLVFDTMPRYIAGGTSDRGVFATLTSRMARIASVQPLRMGVSRQIARSASIAPYLELSDHFAQRIVGASIVFEGVSERTRR